jgi:hypothetical protein
MTNLHVYHYAGNNPVKYTDPDGRAPRNLSDKQREIYMNSVAGVSPAIIPDVYDCADTALFIYNRAMAANGQPDAFKSISKNGSKLNNLRDIQAADLFGLANINNRIINYYDSSGSGQTYDSSKADRSFNSKNVEVGTVGIYKPAPGARGFTGHTITVTGVTRDRNGNITSIKYIEGHQGTQGTGIEQTEYTFTREGGGFGESSLHNRYSDTIFVGWGEFEP